MAAVVRAPFWHRASLISIGILRSPADVAIKGRYVLKP
jgi:hypothetical protein